ncbi:hypothetical protein LCGC14_2753410, partial [marine sediment metagenome]
IKYKDRGTWRNSKKTFYYDIGTPDKLAKARKIYG